MQLCILFFYLLVRFDNLVNHKNCNCLTWGILNCEIFMVLRDTINHFDSMPRLLLRESQENP